MLNKCGYSDFHCHLDDDCFAKDWQQLVSRCFAQGMCNIVSVADPFKEISLGKTKEIMAYHANVYAVCGAHPHQADLYSPAIEKRIFAFYEKAKYMAVGEAGLDFHYDFASRENQEKTFRRQIAIARELALPLVIHSRNAEVEVLEILLAEKFPGSVVFHCYTGNMASAAEILQRGYSISISGIVTFKKADELREIVTMIPMTNLFTETDSPYLSPEPRRGETNTPLGVIEVVKQVAALKNMTAAQVNEAVAQNLSRLLKIN
ncbi:MAG: TatD family hydrolase [Candidatus Aminicenantes bacterium]|nr:TatD family hydrolase [Candidatus Aminicenantes bacterium]